MGCVASAPRATRSTGLGHHAHLPTRPWPRRTAGDHRRGGVRHRRLQAPQRHPRPTAMATHIPCGVADAMSSAPAAGDRLSASAATSSPACWPSSPRSGAGRRGAPARDRPRGRQAEAASPSASPSRRPARPTPRCSRGPTGRSTPVKAAGATASRSQRRAAARHARRGLSALARAWAYPGSPHAWQTRRTSATSRSSPHRSAVDAGRPS
jgi:hypothetical protein